MAQSGQNPLPHLSCGVRAIPQPDLPFLSPSKGSGSRLTLSLRGVCGEA